MQKKYLFLLSILSGLLLGLSWFPNGLSFLIFFAFVPLFFISDFLLQKEGKNSFGKGLLYSYPAFLIWNAVTTWWIWNSTAAGAVAGIMLNALLMSLVFACWHCLKKHKLPTVMQPVVFISFWMSWEYLHLNWDLSWPWLNLGNVFASCTQYVQWYQFTGTFGGTLWILMLNFILYYLIKSIRQSKRALITQCVLFGTILFIPILISVSMYQYRHRHFKDETPIEAIIVQQNTDPWEEQYTMANVDHCVRIIQVFRDSLTANTQLIIASESSIPHTISEKMLLEKSYPPETYDYYGFVLFDTVLKKFPRLNIIAGLSTCADYDHKATPTARKREDGLYFDLFNTSMCYNIHGCKQVYHKSRLVPGVEKMPYPRLFGFLEKFVINLGGPSGSLGCDTAQHAFITTINNGTLKIGVPICYESIYGEVCSRFVKDGAQLIAIITNDAWWKNTPGHRQHFLMARLRAVETRRTILRAANTGTSAFIDECGDVYHETNYAQRTAIKQNVFPNDEITFYVKHGDYLAKLALIISALSLLYTVYLQVFNIFLQKRKHDNK